MNLGTLKRLKPRSLWKNKSADFTPWLADNLDSLDIGDQTKNELAFDRLLADK